MRARPDTPQYDLWLELQNLTLNVNKPNKTQKARIRFLRNLFGGAGEQRRPTKHYNAKNIKATLNGKLLLIGTVKQIADELGMPASTVYKKLYSGEVSELGRYAGIKIERVEEK